MRKQTNFMEPKVTMPGVAASLQTAKAPMKMKKVKTIKPPKVTKKQQKLDTMTIDAFMKTRNGV